MAPILTWPRCWPACCRDIDAISIAYCGLPGVSSRELSKEKLNLQPWLLYGLPWDCIAVTALLLV